MRMQLQRAALWLFWLYLGLYPESLLLVALNRVPDWGLWMGSLLLILQGLLLLAWLGGRYGRRGLLGGLLLGGLGGLVEHIGVTTGLPFGRYAYTDVLQPQVFGVPLAICCAWLMVVPTAYQGAAQLLPTVRAPARLLCTATLVLALDMQIETVAVHVNGYWRWLVPGPYYGVPLSNFVAWWVVGFAFGGVLLWLDHTTRPHSGWLAAHWQAAPRSAWLLRSLPWVLYLLNTLMFSAINLARGYWLASGVGLAVLALAGAVRWGRPAATAAGFALHRTPD